MTRALALCLPLVASPAFAADFTPADMDAFVAAFAGNGCRMTEDEAEVLIPGAGLTAEVSRAIGEHLLDAGLATEVRFPFPRFMTLSHEICQ